MLNMGLKMNFLLIQPQCQISKRLYCESKPCCYLRTPLNKHMTIIIQPVRHNTKVRNNDIIHALPLKIFFCWHSNMSIKHHKWSFCSINSVVIYPKCPFIWRVWFRKYTGSNSTQHDYTLSNKLPVNFVQTFQTTFLIQL